MHFFIKLVRNLHSTITLRTMSFLESKVYIHMRRSYFFYKKKIEKESQSPKCHKKFVFVFIFRKCISIYFNYISTKRQTIPSNDINIFVQVRKTNPDSEETKHENSHKI